MHRAKDVRIAPISSSDANRIIRSLHYSGTIVQNSQLHLGVFIDGRCGGAMQFGPSLDKRKMMSLVRGTAWNEFLELNRMAFAEWLPRNSESRSIGYAMRWIRSKYSHIRWVVSFADATQCGDGTIYRASGFVLTGIKRNSQLFRFPDGSVDHKMDYELARSTPRQRELRSLLRMPTAPVTQLMRAAGAFPIEGYQLRYVYFIDKSYEERLAVPRIPFDMISRSGAGMYKGQKRAGSADSGTPAVQAGRGGATPTPALFQTDGADHAST